MQKKVRNVTMAKSNKTALEHFPETATGCLLGTIDKDVVDTHKEFTGDRSPTVSVDSDVQEIPTNNDFSKTFEKEKFDRECFGKFELHYIC